MSKHLQKGCDKHSLTLSLSLYRPSARLPVRPATEAFKSRVEWGTFEKARHAHWKMMLMCSNQCGDTFTYSRGGSKWRHILTRGGGSLGEILKKFSRSISGLHPPEDFQLLTSVSLDIVCVFSFKIKKNQQQLSCISPCSSCWVTTANCWNKQPWCVLLGNSWQKGCLCQQTTTMRSWI